MESVDLKLVLLGHPGVGKTCLVYRYLYNTFGETISVSIDPPPQNIAAPGGACFPSILEGLPDS